MRKDVEARPPDRLRGTRVPSTRVHAPNLRPENLRPRSQLALPAPEWSTDRRSPSTSTSSSSRRAVRHRRARCPALALLAADTTGEPLLTYTSGRGRQKRALAGDAEHEPPMVPRRMVPPESPEMDYSPKIDDGGRRAAGCAPLDAAALRCARAAPGPRPRPPERTARRARSRQAPRARPRAAPAPPSRPPAPPSRGVPRPVRSRRLALLVGLAGLFIGVINLTLQRTGSQAVSRLGLWGAGLLVPVGGGLCCVVHRRIDAAERYGGAM